MQERGQIIVLPVIVEPCDWLSTPFSKFKALPKDGKAVSIWENSNTAFLDVIQNIRNLVLSSQNAIASSEAFEIQDSLPVSRNYRVKKDFDTIEKIDFVEKTFKEVKEYLKRYIEEIVQLDNIKAIVSSDVDSNFECIVVNRNKISTEAHLKLSTVPNVSIFNNYLTSEKHLSYAINQNMMPHSNSFVLNFDDYHLFWVINNFSSYETKELSSKDIADFIWEECLEKAGIV